MLNVVLDDLESLSTRLSDVFRCLSGHELLILGGGGFLGHYLVQAPLHWNRANPESPPIRVSVHDSFRRGVPAWLDALDDSALTIVERDVLSPLPTDMPRFSFVMHAASIASPTFYRRYPIETMDANVGGLRLVLDYAADRASSGEPLSGLLFFSTSEIYGDPDAANIPTPETYRGLVSCTGPRACYDESKRYGETLSVNYAQMHNVPVTVVRPFNNYGPGLRLDDRRVISDFARDIVMNRDIELLSDGSATRTFCYVTDAVDGYYRALVKGRRGEAYNVGTDGPEICVRGVAEEMASIGKKISGYDGDVVTGASGDPDYLTDNPNRRCPVIDKARTELGYEPQIKLEDGLERTLRWYFLEREKQA